MNNESLKGLHDYLQYLIDENNIDYSVYESGVIRLYDMMIEGKAARKDFLTFAICDMATTLIENDIVIKSTQWSKFVVTNQSYIEKEWGSLLE